MNQNATTPALGTVALGESDHAERPVRWPARVPAWAWWTRPVGDLPGVGPAGARHAASLGIATVADLLQHLPHRYESFDDGLQPVGALRPGQEATVRVVLDTIGVHPTRRRGLVLVRARVHDDSGPITLTWFNQRHLARQLHPGDRLLVRGRMGAPGRRELAVRSHEVLDGETSEGLHTTGLVPVYPASERFPSRRVRELVDRARPLARTAPDPLPTWARVRLGRAPIADALSGVHFPRTLAEATDARCRLALGELLVLQVGLAALRRRDARRRTAPVLRATGAMSRPLLEALPFRPTGEQERAAAQIGRDLRAPTPMRRLLQGEVGSGKTLVALLAICQAVEGGAQAALLAPTETLAEQHLRTLDRMLAPTGHLPVLLTGRIGAGERRRRLQALAAGTAAIAVGTQALLSPEVRFARLGLVVVDEQHRFGVAQRHALSEATAALEGESPHLLYMTATPIPRTLALTDYGDLAVTTIRHRPPGRAPVETLWYREQEREEAYERIRVALRAGRQAYVVCPLVEEGEGAQARAATAEARRLAEGPFADFRVALAHGAQRSDEKLTAMNAFAAGEVDLLVATTVVEVGIDVPNATVMLIEDADRFGLAQLHQLRGRVGRGEHPGTCILFGEPSTPEGERRLEALVEIDDGFRLAQVDLDIRDTGSLLGVRQAGPSDLRVADRRRHRRELAQARRLARWILRDDPHLRAPAHHDLRAAVAERFAAIPRLLDG
ncbi:MAG TPA: ATP-dependent DNA helicase RecG [Miltoncostaeaceae bacterium]|nr:ATP-dependent DNA helicase RecG [Miltoncostaeaceae bacterium]